MTDSPLGLPSTCTRGVERKRREVRTGPATKTKARRPAALDEVVMLPLSLGNRRFCANTCPTPTAWLTAFQICSLNHPPLAVAVVGCGVLVLSQHIH